MTWPQLFLKNRSIKAPPSAELHLYVLPEYCFLFKPLWLNTFSFFKFLDNLRQTPQLSPYFKHSLISGKPVKPLWLFHTSPHAEH